MASHTKNSPRKPVAAAEIRYIPVKKAKERAKRQALLEKEQGLRWARGNPKPREA